MICGHLWKGPADLDTDRTSAVREEIDPDSPPASAHPAAAPKARADPAPPPRLGELRAIRRLLTGILILLGLGAAYFAQVILIPLTAAVLLNFLFKPMVRRLEYARVRIPPPLSAMLIMGTLFAAIFIGGSTLWGSLTAWIDTAPQSIDRLEEKLDSLRAPMRQVTQATEKLEEAADAGGEAGGEGRSLNEPVEVQVKESAFPSTAFNVTTTFLAGLTITLVLAFFLLASGDLLLRQLVQAVPNLADKKQAVQGFYDLESHVSAYLLTVTCINTGLAVVVWGAMWMIGLPYAMWWGITAGVTNFVPYLGPLLATVLLFAASLLAFDTVGQALIPPLVFVTVSTIEGYFVTPTIVGRRLSLNPLILFLWLVFWGWLWGIGGAVLAVPMLICLKIVCDHIARLEPLSHLLSGYIRPPGENASPPINTDGHG